LKKIEEIERLENSINELRAQLLYDDTWSVIVYII
jgi:hypothetical protein